ncbi:CocE/NonD family hydrolase [Phenylobacterium sp. LH3H17]|uniref:CocE/NonD family hydrolase n=1 Tax=Phenylobacterium sp. LH3H17 TaxID=2903901 RepID=UPI0020C9AD55|nr:CocE/NonD family hydrolase [Phenylobacterium sp. LH3H17]UTP38312.1 CocE/NonD family hydrolase [Phenylobacterium sp. LH3H17]
MSVGSARIAAMAAAALLGALAGGGCEAAPPERPFGWSDSSYYLPMRDGVRLAVSLYYPGGQVPGAKAPAILIQTRYGRAIHFAYSQARDYQRWREAGYVVAVVDTRGSTASFGARNTEIGPDEVRDMDELVDHLRLLPWSNGQVIAAGVSYMADTADWATSRPTPLLGAIARETDFDVYLHLFMPGGVSNDFMLNGWGREARNIDLGRDGEGKTLDCAVRLEDCPKLFPTLQPVDGDVDFRLLRQAIAGRLHWGPEDYYQAEFRDDKGRNGFALFDLSPASAIDDIRLQRKPVQYWGSWVDGGTAEAALARFRSAPEVSMEVWITANDHTHRKGADPLRPGAVEPTPSPEEQFKINLEFAERLRAGVKVERKINYYVMGAGRFKQTTAWPPEGVAPQFLALGADGALHEGAAAVGSVSREVDFTATTGKQTRWSTQFGTPPAYADRRAEDHKLIVFDTKPMTADVEVAGTPVVRLSVATETDDPVFFAYLEDVSPEGRVSYLTEGQIRAVHRRPADPASLPYDQGPAPHSYARADAQPMNPGETAVVEFAMFPVAALVRKGHRLRLAIAGADADTFRRYPKAGAERFTLRFGGGEGSGLALTTRPWRD